MRKNTFKIYIFTVYCIVYKGKWSKIRSVAAGLYRLPCDISPPTSSDRVSLVLWFREEEGKPIYR